MNFELREMKLGLREIKLSCEVLDSQSHRTKQKKFLFQSFTLILLYTFYCFIERT